MAEVIVGDLPMYYAWHGAADAEPLVLISGLGLDVSELPPSLLAGLARRYRVLVFDNRGAGRTGAPPPPYTVEQMAADTAGLMRACGLARATVLGVSLVTAASGSGVLRRRRERRRGPLRRVVASCPRPHP